MNIEILDSAHAVGLNLGFSFSHDEAIHVIVA
jgi:hypothetical protein